MQPENIPVNYKLLEEYSQRPSLFAPGTATFWNDPHISKGLLKCHLDPECDFVSRTTKTMEVSVEWILKESGLKSGGTVLDLGCGPGLYCCCYAMAGLEATGVDLSERSINYARWEAKRFELDIDYYCMDYRELDFCESHELVTLIYCDLGVFPAAEAAALLAKIYRALRPGGKFIFDLYTRKVMEEQKEWRRWDCNEYGLFCSEPHLLLQETFIYPEEQTYLRQFITATADGTMQLYRLWGHCYEASEIEQMLREAGFSEIKLFDDITGKPYTGAGETLAVVAVK